VTIAGGLLGVLVAFHSARTFERDAARAALTAAVVDQATRAQALVSADVLEASALQVVRAVCPDFDPTSVRLDES
jgi:hypothetical protein